MTNNLWMNMITAVALSVLGLNAQTQAQPVKPDTTADEVLVVSQLFLAGSGIGKVVSHTSRNVQETRASSAASLGLIGTSVAIEKILQKRWTRKQKMWVAVGNMVAGAVLTGYLTHNVAATRAELRKARGL